MARGLPTGGRGSKVYVLCPEHKEHKHFRPGTRPGGSGYPAGRIGDRGDRQIGYVPNVYHQHQNVCNTKKILRRINFVKITKNIFQSTRLPEERMGVTEKIGGRNEFP